MSFAPAVFAEFRSPRYRSPDSGFERFAAQAFANRNRLNVQEDEKSWTVTLDLPGLAREDLSIGIEDAVIRIETKAEAKRAFKAAYELPQAIDAAASEARLELGVLTLKLGKLVPVSKSTTLEIK
jgi:HSP20 family protein